MDENFTSSQFEQGLSILIILGGVIEKLRNVATLLQEGKQNKARSTLQKLPTQVEQLITTLSSRELSFPSGKATKEEFISQLQLVQEDIAEVKSSIKVE
ncbi:MAG: hypothetical protein U9Q23_03555 [Candidatus Bipolaricaulota bacterium]|nr:hypothetical protein [Candidatus Bipolaricaulota bacterium]